VATEIIKTIKSSGGDYSSLSGFVAGEARDLVTADEIAVAECYTLSGADVAATISGFTADPTRYVKVYTPAAERHDGKWNSSKYRIEGAVQWGGALRVITPHTTIDGLQVRNTSTGSETSALRVDDTADISNNILTIDKVTAGNADSGIFVDGIASGATVRAWNNIIYNCGTGIYYQWASASTFVLYNNTVMNCDQVGINFVGSATLYLKNNICNGNSTDYTLSNLASLTSNNNISEDSSSPDASYRNLAVTFVNEGSYDFHLDSSDTSAIDAGANLSADGQLSFSDDIDGEIRSGTWDIGADELPSGGVTKTVSDTAGGSDAISQLAVGLTMADSGSGSDGFAGMAADLSLSDAGSGSDVIAQLLASLAVLDTGHGDDSQNITVSFTVVDTGTGSDLVNVITDIIKTVTDTGSGIENVQVSPYLAVSDTAQGTEIVGLNVLLSIADTGAGSDALSSIQTVLSVADAGSGQDAVPVISVTVPVVDTAQGLDLIASVNAALQVADSGSGFDIVSASYDGQAKKVVITFKSKKPGISFSGRTAKITFASKKPKITFH